MCASPQNGPPEPSLSPPELTSTPPTPQNTSINGQSEEPITAEEPAAPEQNATKSAQPGTFFFVMLTESTENTTAVCDMHIYLFWLVICYLCIPPELQESDLTVSKPLEERVGEGEEVHLEAETEPASVAQEEAEPDSGLGESSADGGEGQSSINTHFTT